MNLPRVLVSFSCGIPSACAAKLAIEKYGDRVIVYYCNTFRYEHPDNRRFFKDVQKWIGRKIIVLKSKEYKSIKDVWNKTGWLVGPGGARCTVELKKLPREDFQEPDDIHILGFTLEESERIKKFKAHNPELDIENILVDMGMTRTRCFEMILKAGIEVPAMYKLGYKNNNCIGCVKGQAGYWNKIRKDFPDVFMEMARRERRMDVAINKRYIGEERIRVFLDELNPKAGRYKTEESIECGIFCSGGKP